MLQVNIFLYLCVIRILNFLFYLNSIETAIETRTDISFLLTDDRYVFFYIARHIREAGMVHLLPILYLDFGFLEQKLRATGLPNTIGDLQTYRTEIIGKQ